MKHLYVANWKMNMTYAQSIDFCIQNKGQLHALANTANIILCPSFLAIAPIIEILKDTNIKIGAQNCSEHQAGSYTGEISAQSLSESSATYCIIGHSERRIYFEETTEIVIKKMNLLYANNITPIICIGETKEDFLQQKTKAVLEQQLESILQTAVYHQYNHIIIAYEPFWAIGTGIIPEAEYLEDIFSWLHIIAQPYIEHKIIQFLYGGSVNSKNIHQLKTIEHIDGFLIGGASVDFEELRKIITL